MHTGKIKKLVKDRGFGFIQDTDGREVFVHRTQVQDSRLEDLKEGQAVTFDVEAGERGPEARNVRPAIVSPSPISQ